MLFDERKSILYEQRTILYSYTLENKAYRDVSIPTDRRLSLVKIKKSCNRP